MIRVARRSEAALDGLCIGHQYYARPENEMTNRSHCLRPFENELCQPDLPSTNEASEFMINKLKGPAEAGRNAAPDTLEPLRAGPEDADLARQIHERFSRLEGAEHIASVCSLQWLAAVLRTFRPKRVLELGAGIGTMTELLLTPQFGVEKVYSTEDNAFCLAALRRNLPRLDGRLELLTTGEDLRKIEGDLDLIAGDGGFYSPLEFCHSRAGTILFFEGSRSKLRGVASETLARQGLRCEMRQYGAGGTKWKLGWVWGMPIPRRVRQRAVCWIGMVQSLPGAG